MSQEVGAQRGRIHSRVLIASPIPGGLHILKGDGFQMTLFKN